MGIELVTLIPIIVCLIFIFVFKNPYIAIGLAILSGVGVYLITDKTFILDDAIKSVITNIPTLRITGFILLVGGIIMAMNKSGGVDGLISFLERRKFNTNSKVLTQLFIMFIGILLFINGPSSIAVTSVVGKPLFQKNAIPNEKLALLTNSTASPIAWLIPFGTTGALTASLLAKTELFGSDTLSEVIKAMPFQFYTISLLLLLIISIIFKFEIGPVKRLKRVSENHVVKFDSSKKARNLILPLIFLVTSILVLLGITGSGNILKGNTSFSIFFASLITLSLTFLLYKTERIKTSEILTWFLKGFKSMLKIVLLLIIAYIFSDILKTLKTPHNIVKIFEFLPTASLPIMTFIIASLISFSTGTSIGTVSILVPLLIPVAISSNIDVSVVLGAIVSGAVFGDQNSIISDSVILTSSVTDIKAIDHVKTQMPYTLIAFGVSALLYVGYIFVK